MENNNYFTFGKYKGESIDDIISLDFNYCLWVADKEYKESSYIRKTELYKSYNILSKGEIVPVMFITNGYNYNTEDNTCYSKAKYYDNILIIKSLCSNGRQGRYEYIKPNINGKPRRVKNKILHINITNILSTRLKDSIIEQIIEVF